MSDTNIELDDIVLTLSKTCLQRPLSQASNKSAEKSVSDDMGVGVKCLPSLETQDGINTRLGDREPELPVICTYDPELSGNYFHHIISSAVDGHDVDAAGINKFNALPSVQEKECTTISSSPPETVKRNKPVRDSLYKRLLVFRLLGPANQSRDSCCDNYCFLTWQRRFRRRKRLNGLD